MIDSRSLRALILCSLVAVFWATMGLVAPVSAQDKKAPDTLSFTAKNGNVTFNHEAHVKKAKGDCKTCHDTLFPKDAKAALNFKPALHKTAETAKTSCGFCHTAGGASFESKGNCAKCHVKS